MPNIKRRWTVDDLADLPDDGNRYEIIDGELIVSPAPSYTHQEAAVRLHGLLRDYLRLERIGHAYLAPADVTFSRSRVVQPDVFVVPLHEGRRPRSFADVGRLLLGAEVLSPSTAHTDRVAKRTLYRDEGVPTYLLIDLDARVFELSVPGEPRIEIVVDQLVWHPDGAGRSLVIDVRSYFEGVLDT